MNHFYKYLGFSDIGDYNYLSKKGEVEELQYDRWFTLARQMVDIDFFDADFSKQKGQSPIKGHFYFRSAYRNEPDFQIDYMQRQIDPTTVVRLPTLIQNDQTVSDNYQRLISNTVSEVFNANNNQKTVEELRDELTGKIRDAMN